MLGLNSRSGFKRRGPVVAFLCVLIVAVVAVYFFYWIPHAGGDSRASSEKALHATESLDAPGKCVVYVVTNGVVYEFAWVMRVVLRDLPRQCGCVPMVISVEDFAGRLQSQDSELLHSRWVFVLMGQILFFDEAPWSAAPVRLQLRASVVLHLSDENELFNVSYYKLFRRVYRNYYTQAPDRATRLDYLLMPSPDKLDDPVRWAPIGFSSNFISGLPSAQSAHRPRLFSWAGSVAGRPEREHMIQSLQANPAVARMGWLHKFGEFNHKLGGGDHLGSTEYSRLLYESKVVPCPAGHSPDQFRIYEALEAGAVPVVRPGQRHLQWISMLGFEFLTVESFSDLSTLLANFVDACGSSRALSCPLHPLQAKNAAIWSSLKSTLAAAVASDVCSSESASER